MRTLRQRFFTLGLVLLAFTVLLGYTRLVQVSQGGTGASTASDARTTLGGGLGRVPVHHVASGAPTTGDDSGDGYAAGDLWTDTTGNVTYVADAVGVGAADWRSLLRTTSVKIYLSGGAWYYVPQGWNGTSWVDTGAAVALSVETTSASASLSDTTLTIKAGALDCPAPHNAFSKWYLTLSDLAMWDTTDGATYAISTSTDSYTTTDRYPRWGWALAAPSGSFDVNTENRFSARYGYDNVVTNWIIRYAVTTGSYPTLLYNQTNQDTWNRYIWQNGVNQSQMAAKGSSIVTGSITPGTTLATRLYILALAAGTVVTDGTFTNPVCRITRLDGSP